MATAPTRPSCLRETLAAFGIYAVITIAFFTPILGRIRSGLITAPGIEPPSDHLQVLWNAWWIRKSLFSGKNPYFCDMLFVPHGTPLVLHFLTPIESAAIALLTHKLPVELSYNLVIMLGLPIAGIGAYALCRQITGSHPASIVGGTAFMLSPFVVSKAAAGWINMVYAGVLPIFLACLLRCTADERSRPPLLSRIFLALSALFVLFTDDVLIVFAANLSAFVFVWRCWQSGSPLVTAKRFARIFDVTVIASTPFVAVMAYYVIHYGFALNVGRRLDYVPDVLSYIAPFSNTSVYSAWLLGTFNFGEKAARDLVRTDTACYLGALVLPLALSGMVMGRSNPTVRFMAGLFFSFLILSMGPQLLFFRHPVHVGSLALYLPFGLWQRVPLLGAVSQSGRYLAISYMAASVGIAALGETMIARWGRTIGRLACVAVAFLVCFDFAFTVGVNPLPPRPNLSSHAAIVLDPRLRSGQTMYYQTLHERPLMGGYLSRRPEFALERYREVPGLNCVFFGDPAANCDRTMVISSLRNLEVTDILLDPGDRRGEMLGRYGFRQQYSDPFTVVWIVPSLP